MTHSTFKALGAGIALAGTTLFAQPALAQADPAGDESLAAETLSDGESVRAIALLKAALEKQQFKI